VLAPPSTDAAFVAEIEELLKAADDDIASATRRQLDIGRKLNAKKETGKRDGTIPHGEWLNWLEKNFPPRNGRDRVRRLQHYMQAADAIDTGDETTKTKLSSFLPQGIDAVLDELRRIKQQNKPKPEPEPTQPHPRHHHHGGVAAEPFFKILQGDVRQLTADLPKVHCVITSPPYYNKITYGDSDREVGHEQSVEAYIAGLVAIFNAIPLHPQGSIWVNIGDKRNGRGGLLNIPGLFCTAMQANGFLLIDCVVWAKSVARVDGTTIGRVLPEPYAGRLNGNGYEMLFHFTKGDSAWTDTYAVQASRYNVEPQRYLPENLMKTIGSLNGRNLTNVWLMNGRNIQEHYGCFPPVLVERPVAMTCPPFVNPDGSLPRRLVDMVEYDDGIGRRTFGRDDPDSPIQGRHDTGVPYIPRMPVHRGWEEIAANASPGVVLDPFAGTGTTGEVALKLGRSFIGIELYENYAEIARKRCTAARDHVLRNHGYDRVYEMILEGGEKGEEREKLILIKSYLLSQVISGLFASLADDDTMSEAAE
jgi:site-specific DNA-methyltransferase (adenine-specific)